MNMTPQQRELADVVRATIADVLGADIDVINDNTDLRAEFDIDSLELMAVGAQLERVLGVRIEPEELVRAETVGHAVELLVARQVPGDARQVPVDDCG
ncbi:MULTISPECIES: acyl carrier protein [unclassified Frankia]|uniref:acyl carrier protein n=2 Tax=Frankia TaxID=1854 RepID=UPI001EF3F897|nr:MULTISPECIES: acyl carrier protein [unclassified Frankia]